MKGKRNGFPYPERRDIDIMCVCLEKIKGESIYVVSLMGLYIK